MAVTQKAYQWSMKCDLHIHSVHSGMCEVPVLRRFCRESYNQPLEVYETLKRRGMDLVTLTDHDAIEGAEALRRYPDFFLSEELTCQLPSGTTIHIGVFDLTERQHIEIQRRRNDLVSLLMYLTERRLFFTLNHVFSALTGRREIEDFAWFEEFFPAFETRNGLLLAGNNHEATQLARKMRKVRVAGSDAHTLASAGTAYTEVPDACDKHEFFAGLRAGKGYIRGEAGGYWKLTRDLWLVGFEMMRERRWTTVLAPLAAFVPAASLANYLCERVFARRWSERVMRQRKARLALPGGREWMRREVWA
jgi:predicted metal-dependent phosphoesterase TrpH